MIKRIFNQDNLLQPQVAKWIFIIVAVLVGLMVLQAISFDQKLWQSTATELAKPTQPKSFFERAPQQTANLFGAYVDNLLEENNVRQSLLNITVVGVMYFANSRDSYVIIQSANQDEEVFKTGDLIMADVKIKRITQDSVFVLHNGVTERLQMPQSELTFEK